MISFVENDLEDVLKGEKCKLVIEQFNIPSDNASKMDEEKQIQEIKNFWLDHILFPMEKELGYKIKKCKRDKCKNLEVCEDHAYCLDCEFNLVRTLRIMNLVNDDITPLVSIHSLKELFE